MDSNFEFLSDEKDWENLYKMGRTAELHIYNDPNTSFMKTRQIGEFIAKSSLILEKIPEPERCDQFQRIKILKNEGLINRDIENIFHELRKVGNDATHQFIGETEKAKILLSFAFKLAGWFKELYGSDHKFSIQNVTYKDPKYINIYEKLDEASNETQREAVPAKNLDTTIQERKKKALNLKVNLSETETRFIIDTKLAQAGWMVSTVKYNYKNNKTLPEKKKNMIIAEWPCIKDDGSVGFADYAFFMDQKLVALLEAKRYSEDSYTALNADAMMYAKNPKLEGDAKLIESMIFNKYKVPFLYSSNGREYNPSLREKSGIFFLDTRRNTNLIKILQGFHSPKDLKELLEKDEEKADRALREDDISYLADKNGLGLRDYQLEAIKAAEKAILNNQKNILISMATGTGKTRTALGLVYRLLKSKKFEKVLFLVDRNELGEQAENTFKNCKVENLHTFNVTYNVKELGKKEIEDSMNVHIATVQSFVKKIYYGNNDERPSIGQYDCIVVDEAHRGYIQDRELTEEDILYRNLDDYLSKYRSVLEYFDAVKIALTATPAIHTAEIFGDPVYDYTYTQAVIDGHLVDYETPYIIETELMKKHIKYSKGEAVDIYNEIKKETSKKVLEDEIDIDVDGFNRKVITKSYNDIICEELATKLNPKGPEKTLIFAVNNSHADEVVKTLKEKFQKVGYPDITEDTVRKITGKVKDVGDLIKKFKNESEPVIAVTVDLLSTGVDIPEISNIVFLRKIKSIILYEQMIGRATRRCDSIKKDHFNIYDAVYLYRDLHKYSRMTSVVKQVSKTYGVLIEEMERAEKDEAYQDKILSEIIAKIQRNKMKFGDDEKELFWAETGWETLDKFIAYIKELPKSEKVNGLKKEIKTLKFLETEYKKIVSVNNSQNEKIISSKQDRLIEVRQEYGENHEKPADYLESFKKYVNEKAEEVEALKILKTNPEKFKKSDLKAINTILENVGYKSTNLQRAWEEVKKEEIVANILIFVKNAITGSPVVDKREQIRDVMKKIYSLSNWNMPQKNILKAIQDQLENNIIITKEDLEGGVLGDIYGGYERMDKQLDNMLENILNIITKEIIMS